ncbi:nucleoside hydrolase [Metschnikowia bicuspidata var. bicuspidata NRRL YB-4993]|uniref:Nucleoside hydrolase n=1 Tax=Metschnikowia bicuspidata var. bicuspidata NRRL YB-4993 TaxID=869754 RepID=A0A1A0HBS8_9ASCO|nr:nucleoside hydrolase [Metschnikowia bicuspidata var. bicuspidata NRRL YB-4993]OBA21466.1 nucleoside hydrolase [Metschnikowia bicuspidata var. bicuspidata NRRL YB-4993]
MPSVPRRSPSAVPVWLDCDPGNDDAFAILLAAFHPSFRLCGISTVHGNVSLRKTTRNALALLEKLRFAQGEIPVYAGEPAPLVVPPLHAEAIHGSYGIGGTDLPETPGLQANTEMPYTEAMARAVEDHAGELCIVCTGALTNLVKFMARFPGLVPKIRLVSIMGGAFDCGNISPGVEFNMRTDPHAAQRVFAAPGLANKILLAPLNLTHTALATPAVRLAIYNPLGKNSSALRKMFSQILTFYNNAYVKKYGLHQGPPIHDPLALFLLLPKLASEAPELLEYAESCDFHYLQRHLDVATKGDELGRTTYVDSNLDPLRVERGGVFVGQSVNIPFFWRHVLAALDLADAQVLSRS